jgi:uncharacterized protein with GYD domain
VDGAGVRDVKKTVTRTEQARAAIEKDGGRLIGSWWTQGAYDVVAVAEWPNDEAASAFMLSLALAGNVRSETMRAYTQEEMQRILQKLP